MGIMDVIFPSKTVAPYEEKGSQLVSESFDHNRANMFNILFEQELSKIDYLQQYKDSVWIYASIDAITTAISSLPINVFRIKNKVKNRAGIQQLLTKYGGVKGLHKKLNKVGNDGLNAELKSIGCQEIKVQDIEEVTDHDLISLIEQPNPHMTRVEFWEKVFLHLELRGDTFWELVGEHDGDITALNPPEQMYIANPNSMIIVPDKKDYIRGYIYEINGQQVPFDPDQIVHMKYGDPIDEFYGQGVIQALTDTLLMERFSVKFNKSFFKNNARLDGVLTTENKLATATYDRVKREWQEKYGGMRNAYSTAILEQGLEYKPMSITQKDADFIKSRKMNREEILAATKVPPVAVGLETNNYATAQVQWQTFYMNNVRPKVMRRDTTLNNKIVPLFDDSLFIETDFSDVQVLRIDTTEEDKRAFETGTVTQNEIREKKGRPLVKNGDILYITQGLVPVASISGEIPDDSFDENEEDEEAKE